MLLMAVGEAELISRRPAGLRPKALATLEVTKRLEDRRGKLG
jgi:hypothetical protein